MLNKISNFFLPFFIVFVPNIIMWIIFFPGYIQADHQITIMGVLNDCPSEWHSLTWGYLFNLGILIFHNYNFAGLCQSFIYSLFITIGICDLKRANVVKTNWCLSLFMGLFPTFLIYNLLYCSDLIFAYCLFVLTCSIMSYVIRFVIYEENGKFITQKFKLNLIRFSIFDKEQKFCIIKIFLFLVLACLMRKNAIIITVSIIIVSCILINFQQAKIIMMFCSASMLFTFGIVACLDLVTCAQKSPSQELLSIPAVQIASVYKYNGTIPQDCATVFEKYHSADDWANLYQCWISDFVKDGLDLNSEFIYSWLKAGIYNFTTYVKAYLNLYSGFLVFGMQTFSEQTGTNNGLDSDFADNSNFTISNVDQNKLSENKIISDWVNCFYEEHSQTWNLLQNVYSQMVLSDFFILQYLAKFILFNRGAPLYVLLFCICVSIWKSRLNLFLICGSPYIGVLCSLLFFAPVACMRYSVTLYYTIPVLIMFVFSNGWAANYKINKQYMFDTQPKLFLN